MKITKAMVDNFDPIIASRMTVVVEYDGIVDAEDIRELVEKAQEFGRVVTADYEILAPTKRSFV